MKFRHYALLLTSICLIAASPSFASQKSALRQSVGTTAQKPAATPEKPWSALNGLPVANTDVPEVGAERHAGGCEPVRLRRQLSAGRHRRAG